MKITINNEEVVCSNNLTITEDMLTTSSTILNNCYPKSWEQDHDYVSRFYYPKDYSKVKIFEEEYTPGEPGTTVEGTNLNINYDNSKLWKLEQIKGNTLQNGTPTPDSPVDIQCVEGIQNVSVCGKNLFDKNTITSGKLVVRTTGELTANANYGATDYIPISANTTITMTNFNVWYTACYDSNKNYLGYMENANTMTTLPNTAYIRASLLLTNLNTAQVEKGNQATTYEAYTGNTYEVNLEGKNLFNKNGALNYPATTGQNRTTLQSDGTLKTTANFSSSRSKGAQLKLKPNTDYVLSGNLISSTGDVTNFALVQVMGYSSSWSSVDYKYLSSTGNFTLTFNSGNNTDWFLSLNANGTVGVSMEAIYDNIQIELGSNATSYVPYRSPIKLYNGDYITGTPDNWSIYRENGRVVLDENSTIIYENGSSTPTERTVFRFINSNKPETQQFVSNYFIYNSSSSNRIVLIANDYTGYISVDNTVVNINTSDSNTEKINKLKTWLSTHNTEVVYKLATPTTETITDEYLISQLNEFATSELYNGTNNITVSGNLAGSLKIKYNYLNPIQKEKLYFCGVVKNTGTMSLNPREPHYASLQVLDFKTMLSEGDTLGFVINNKTVPEAIQMVVDSVASYGIVVGKIHILNPDEVIGAYSTVDKTAYDVLQYLAEISQAKWTTRLVDENTIAVDFYDPTLMEQADDIEYTKEYFENNNIESIEYNYGTYDYRNKQIMISDQVYGSIDYVETILADGYNRIFNTTTNIGLLKTIYVGGVAKTFGTVEDKEIGMDYNFYYTPGQNQLESNENEPIISSNTPIVITYIPLVKGRQIVYNSDEVDRISEQTGRNGIISRYENRNDVLSVDELIKVGETYIKYKGSPEINLIVKSYNYDLFNVGQLVYFNAPINELKKQYMIKQKITTIYRANSQQNIFIEYTLTSSFNSEREVNYFDNQRNKAKGNISAGEYVTRNVDIENTATIIFNNLTTEEITVSGDNVLNSILNSPFNN